MNSSRLPRSGALVLAGIFALSAWPSFAAEAAQPAPLFATDTVLELEFEFDFKGLCRDPTRGDCEDLPATIFYTDADAERHRIDVKLRTRGRWSKETSACQVPALFVFFAEAQTGETPFAGQKMLPFTTHCQHNRRTYHQYTLKEFLAHRLYNLITEESIRARLARVTYRDTASTREYVRYGFFTEHFDDLAARIGAERFEIDELDLRRVDATRLAILSVFQYMIGNLDWSVIHGHNIVHFARADGAIVPVPFDFDYSGLVNAEYAGPPAYLKLRSVRTRKYRGFCRPDIDWEAIFARFIAARPEALDLTRDLQGLRSSERNRARRYLNQSFAIVGSEKVRQRRIVTACRRLPD